MQCLVRSRSRRPATLRAMRPLTAVLTCALALCAPLGLAACGGGDRPYDSTPSSTPELLPPADANDLAATGTAGPTGTTGPTGAQGTQPSTSTGPAAPATGGTSPQPSTGTGTGGTGTGTGTGGTGTGTGTGGGTAPSTGGVSPDGGANAGSVRKFCADNPGAC